MKTHPRNLFPSTRLLLTCLATGAASICLLASRVAVFAQDGSAKTPEAETPKYTADGQLIAFTPDIYREWIYVGTPLTPNELNDDDAPFPEFHNVYISPAAWHEWKKTGTYPEGTVMVKELASVGAKKATSGNGYFEGEFRGLEMSVKDTKRFPAEAKGWGYFSFGHKYPLKTQTAANQFTSCAQCHVANAASDMVFTQYYPVLRAAKGK